MANNWVKLEVYYNDNFIGSFYADIDDYDSIRKKIDEKYGIGCWTKYNII